MMLRRRAGVLGQKAIGVALACSHVRIARYVFASRHGDLGRTAGILASIASAEAPSPAEFSMSVHHAFAGLLSMQVENRQGHTAVAAGPDTFAAGFVEAASSIADQPDTPVILVYCDSPLPAEYALFAEHEVVDQAFAAAIQFGPAHPNQESIVFSVEPVGVNENSDLVQVPPAEAFLRFLLTDMVAASAIGERMALRWNRSA